MERLTKDNVFRAITQPSRNLYGGLSELIIHVHEGRILRINSRLNVQSC